MATKSVIWCMYKDLTDAVKSVMGAKNVFYGNRPKFNDEGAPREKFAVVELPSAIRDLVVGNDKFVLRTRGYIYVFVTSYNYDTLNPDTTGALVDEIVALFPINGKYSCLTNPVIMLEGQDNNGYQITSIAFDVRTKANTFNAV